MRAKRRMEQEQYDMIMECRQSGLSDHQCCLEHEYQSWDFYNWVHRFVNRSVNFQHLQVKTGFRQFIRKS